MIYQVGSLAMLIGGIFLGQGWCDKDKSQKFVGNQTIIAGAIVAAIGLALI